MYNGNDHCQIIGEYIITIFISHYTRRYIMTTNICVIHKNVFLIIQDDV